MKTNKPYVLRDLEGSLVSDCVAEIGGEEIRHNTTYNLYSNVLRCSFRNWSVVIAKEHGGDVTRFCEGEIKGSIVHGDLADIENDVVLLKLALIG